MIEQYFYVYQDWTLEPIPRCFYIGKGQIKRIKHIKRNNKHTHIAKTYGIQRRIVMQLLGDEQGCLIIEKKYIAELHTYYKDPLCDKEIACNFTIGGEGTLGGSGCLGYKHTKEYKQKMSLLNKGKIPSLQCMENAKIAHSKPHTKEHNIKIGLAGLGRKHSEETKKKMSLSNNLLNKGKLTNKQINDIFYDLRSSRLIAKEYKISSSTVLKIKKGKYDTSL